MFKYIFLFFFSTSALADSLQFENIPLHELLKVVYGQVIKKGYFIEDGLTETKLSLMVEYNSPLEAELMLNDALNNAGLVAFEKSGYVVVKKSVNLPEVLVYKPKHRSARYLNSILRASYPQYFNNQSPVNAPNNDNSSNSNIFIPQDIVSLVAPLDVHSKLKELLFSIDSEVPQLLVSGVAYEVTLNKQDGHSFQVIASLLGSKLGLDIKSLSANSPAAVLKLNSANLFASIQILDNDSRFKSVSRPSVRVRSGGSAVFNAGADVPILGAITTNQGVQNQSIEYRSSGVLLDVQPIVLKDSISLKLKQEISSFVQTETGLINSPTLNKRVIETELDLQSGDVLMIGGLQDSSNTANKSFLSLLPKLPFSSSNKISETETVLILEVKKI
jgi:type II secretory pathway component GspD/PulD (secretin)